MSTVLVTDYTWDSLEIERRELARVGASLVVAPDAEEATLEELVIEADAILTCFGRVTPAVLRAGRRLRVVGRYGIGTDNIAVETATEMGIPVTNVPDYCVDEVAEHTMALAFGLARSVTTFDRNIREGRWDLGRGRPIRRMRGQTLGLLGLGSIGRAVAERAVALGLHVIAHVRSGVPADLEALGVENVSMRELAARSDILSLHVPLTDATRHIVDRSMLGAMKETAFLINTARGGVIDQEALVEALDGGIIAGAGLDVFTPEHLDPGHPLFAHPRVIATPHVAFYSEESVAELASRAAANVATVLSGWRAHDTVNPSVYDGTRWTRRTEPTR
ncbi:C-terminal binding protein [Microbacterium sp. NPDC058062]|uniref:C-terminal binding protein n=1 Tax=Microbacterium sp. NPDC058062 TaxID=3346320 RepID=UPI0036DF258D